MKYSPSGLMAEFSSIKNIHICTCMCLWECLCVLYLCVYMFMCVCVTNICIYVHVCMSVVLYPVCAHMCLFVMCAYVDMNAYIYFSIVFALYIKLRFLKEDKTQSSVFVIFVCVSLFLKWHFYDSIKKF